MLSAHCQNDIVSPLYVLPDVFGNCEGIENDRVLPDQLSMFFGRYWLYLRYFCQFFQIYDWVLRVEMSQE